MKKYAHEFSPWAFQSPFLFATKAPVIEVLDSLARLAKADHISSRNKILIAASDDGYNFSYQFQRSSKTSWYTTAFAEGHVWQDGAGNVIVEGTAKIASMHVYGSIGFFIALITIVNVLDNGNFLSLFILLPLVVGAILIFNYCTDRDHVIEHISAAVGLQVPLSTAETAEKDKRAPIAENAKTSTISEESAHTVNRRDSVWNDAISEYDSTQ